MSSHHIVRDGQEPALLITSSYFNTDVLFELLGWSPVVMVYKNALQRVLDLDVKVDVVFCEGVEMDEAAKLVQHQMPVKIKAIENGIQAVYNFMDAENYKALNILGFQTVERSEWANAAENKAIKTVFLTFLHTAQGKFINVKSYQLSHLNSSKWMAQHTLFGVKAMQGGQFIIKGDYTATGEKDIYKTSTNGFVHIEDIEGQVIFEEIF